MTVDVRILADSVNPAGVRLVTWKLTYPRIVHSEFMTHRAFSRNAASSRAIPTQKWLDAVFENPYIPEQWLSNKSGMQAGEPLDETTQLTARGAWLALRDRSLDTAKALNALGVHKQWANRGLEPFQHITVIASSTDYKGFFAQRAHPAAQPEFQALAYKMKTLYESNEPKHLQQREWHLPFIDEQERGEWDDQTCAKVSAARCAAVSYLRQEDERPLEKWLEVFARLAESTPPHLSPLEHPAWAAGHNARLSNFRGWHQLRTSLDPYLE